MSRAPPARSSSSARPRCTSRTRWAPSAAATAPARSWCAKKRCATASRRRSTRAPTPTSSSWRAPTRWRAKAASARARARLRRRRRRHGLPRGDHRPRHVPQVRRCAQGTGARQHHRVRQDAALYAGRAARGGRRAGALSPFRVPRDEQGRAERLPDAAPRGHAEERRRRDADARRAVRLPRLPRLRAQARRTFCQGEIVMSAENVQAAPKPKKSVALSGVPAGNTALCTVGRTGNDLHYRGYDILEFADQAEFEEIGYLLVHGKLPNAAELAAYKTKLRGLRGIPAAVKRILEAVPANTHPMDVMRTACSALGALLPEAQDHKLSEA